MPQKSDDNQTVRPGGSVRSDDDHQAITTILNSLDALVYVSDMQSHELLFFNDYGQAIWGAPQGRKCYQVLQNGQTQPCNFCTNSQLLDGNGKPKAPYVWEFQNTQNGRWYQCRDQAIRWPDGRLVRMEIATDITVRKHMEQQLADAKALAEHLAETDELTQLKNRRAFFQLAKQALLQSSRSSHKVAMLMFDLDHFKLVNDVRGHAAGDAALKAITAKAAELVRCSDVLGRMGGEEFAVFLPDTSLEQAALLAERIRLGIAGQNIQYAGATFHCTASFGVATMDTSAQQILAAPAGLISDLLHQADVAMMQAKQSGRNRVALNSSLPPEPLVG